MAFCNFNSILLLITLVCIIWSTSCHATKFRDTLKPGDTLDSSSTLVSAKGQSFLYFSSFYGDKLKSSYLAVMRNDSGQYYPWIANRKTPILHDKGVLSLDSNRTLKIMHKDGHPIIVLFSAPQTINSTSNVVATLLDSGNFILQEMNPDGSMKHVLWQSFDYPSDTFMPGMKLGVNHRNGHISLLTSGLIDSARPFPGAFTLEWDPKGHQLQIKRRGVIYWSSGPFKDGGFEFLSPYDERNKLRVYDFSIVSNEIEDYFTYTTVNQSYESPWLLSREGELFDYEGVTSARADSCDGYNTDGGCQKRHQPSCRHPYYTFQTKVGDFFGPDDSDAAWIDSNASISTTDCMAACWEDCNCQGFKSLFDNMTGCQFYTAHWTFSEFTSADSAIYFVLTKSPRHIARKFIWIGTATAAALLVMLVCVFCYLLRRRNLAIAAGENNTKIENELLEMMESDRSTAGLKWHHNDRKVGHDLRVFSYSSIVAATSDFSNENKLGQGGFGPVYKGKLEMGREIAVKRLSKNSGQGILELKNELVLISELQHTNLVELFGFCIHGEERMLIYAYMPNKSLDYFLFDVRRAMLLDWKKRFSIIEGIAQGLLYLHKYSRLRVIHRDLKASNILLDENMNPKISDFGMARIFTHNELEANTNKVVGTYGYMSPEYAMEGIFSIKSDVYSFGVLMLEIISGRRNNSFYNPERVLNIVGYAWDLWKEGDSQQLMDPTLIDSCVDQNQLSRCIHVALLCVEENAADRPTMSDVISLLTNNESIDPFPNPTRPAFVTRTKMVEDNISRRKLHVISVNVMSNSIIDGR